MALPGGIECDICGMTHGNTMIYDRTCTDMTMYPQIVCGKCQFTRKIIWDYLDRIKEKKMEEDFHFKDCGIAGGFPHPASAHKECICIQDESRGWKDCPEHGHKYKLQIPAVANINASEIPEPKLEARYIVMYEGAIRIGTVEDSRYTYYYKTHEDALREGEKWLAYRPTVVKRNMNAKDRICQFFTIEKRYYTPEYCEEWFNDDGSQKDKRQCD